MRNLKKCRSLGPTHQLILMLLVKNCRWIDPSHVSCLLLIGNVVSLLETKTKADTCLNNLETENPPNHHKPMQLYIHLV